MRFFRRTDPPAASILPSERGDCACSEHIEDLRGEVVTPAPTRQFAYAPFTVGELLDGRELGVRPVEAQGRWLDLHGSRERIGPFHFTLWVSDGATIAYADDATLQMDAAIRDQPGVELVEWEDREVFHVSAPTLCADGVLAAAARALMDPRVKQ
ncbi:hypothetical protein [Nocardioides sp.]|uniref:hypothetical protein n=1 Tax=Nocardioides sp. TaxID=35761 RepID=UPI002D010EE6|nr:hypothetical protein [Nocardioides sp.]HXH78015.1 hypothetical protein [Nocardioides sp.]